MSYLDGAQSREAQNEKIKLIAHTLQTFGVAVTVALFGKPFYGGFQRNCCHCGGRRHNTVHDRLSRAGPSRRRRVMTDNDLLIVSIAGLLIAGAGWLAARYTVWRRRKELAAHRIHPAE